MNNSALEEQDTNPSLERYPAKAQTYYSRKMEYGRRTVSVARADSVYGGTEPRSPPDLIT